MPQVENDSVPRNWGLIVQCGAGICAVASKTISLLAVGACVLVYGCRNNGAIIWSKEVRSPDGHWLATAATKQWSGPGSAYVETDVSLKSSDSSQPPVEVLGFSNESAYPLGVTNVKMDWVTPKHLNVTYGRHATLDFQAVRCAGIDISVQNLSDETSKTP
jgi:hypothetical protein